MPPSRAYRAGGLSLSGTGSRARSGHMRPIERFGMKEGLEIIVLAGLCGPKAW